MRTFSTSWTERAAWRAGALLAVLLALPAAAPAADREPCTLRDPLRRPWFGDLHVHTVLSLDASTQGTRTRPREAYAFARGRPVGLQPWSEDGRPLRTARLARPLDFAAVTDHAELFGETHTCNTPGIPGFDSIVCRVYRRWPRLAFFVMNGRALSSGSGSRRHRFCGPDGALCLERARGPWREVREAAEEAYDRSAACTFTSFVGYEWTAAPNGRNLHRNVIFASEAVPDLPVDAVRYPTPWQLWRELEARCRPERGCDYLVIPHNSNLSGGLLFAPVGESGQLLTPAEARLRARSERLVEVMQHKGDSECFPGVGLADELCGFEKLPYDNFMARYLPLEAEAPRASGFVRPALGEGLRLARTLGVNPHPLGLLASTDTHLGTPGLVAEDGYPGHGGAGFSAGRSLPEGLVDPIEFNPGGLAVVWAEENSRESIFAALRRREVYGTSGPRMVVRVFAGASLPEDFCRRPDRIEAGYRRGVPMGGVVPEGGAGHPPRIAVLARRDPGTEARPGAPLERIELIKLFVRDGEVRQRVIDLARAAGRGADPETCGPPEGGADELCALYEDDDHRPGEPALYYARVLQLPTCRWSRRACRAARVDCRGRVPAGFEGCCDPRFPATVRERAWTSPVFTPAALAP